MSDIPEALGSAAEGGLLARAVEKRDGETVQGKTHPHTCLNCGTPLLGTHCHECGQPGHVHRSMAAIGHDLLHGVLHLDGKFWNTLPLLLWQPGRLTRRYIDGERAKFVSPMAMFLFSVFAMFAVFQMAGLSTPVEINPSDAKGQPIASARDQMERQRDTLAKRIEEAEPGSAERARLEAELADFEEGLAAVDTIPLLGGREPVATVKLDTGSAALDKMLDKWRKNPSLMLYKLQSNFYKFSWLLIPLSVPFVWLLFCWRREFHLYDHTIYVTYSLAFVSLLFIVLTLLQLAGLPLAAVILAGSMLPLWHMHRQMKGTYAIGNRAALWRVAMLAWFITLILALFLNVLLLLGLMG